VNRAPKITPPPREKVDIYTPTLSDLHSQIERVEYAGRGPYDFKKLGELKDLPWKIMGAVSDKILESTFGG